MPGLENPLAVFVIRYGDDNAVIDDLFLTNCARRFHAVTLATVRSRPAIDKSPDEIQALNPML